MPYGRVIALFVGLQVFGLAFDAAWHGLVHPGFEAASVRQMAAPLATVHLPLYAGVAGFLVAVAVTLVRSARRGTASPAWTHLRLAPEALAPATPSLTGFVVALVALGLASRRRHRAAPAPHGRERRAA
jgi:hypothetical protein